MDGTGEFSGEEDETNRLASFKARSAICDQETRRLQLLSDQKRRREKAFNDFRNVDFVLDWDNEDEPYEKSEEYMEWSHTKPKQPRLKDLFMLSEWMITLPEDFENKWMFVMCPAGKRCLVRCSKGHTSAYGKRGQRLAKFQSALPNGSLRDASGCRYSNSEVTILDCIWNSQSKSYFILDLLSWKGQLYMDTEASFRAFWIKSKMEEIPNILERSEQNTYPFTPLDYHSCDLSTVATEMSKYASSHADKPKIDGILFYHSEAYYTPGSSPLALWLKPYMLSEVLNMTVPDFFENLKPSSYIDKDHFIMEYETKKLKNKKRLSKKNKTVQEMTMDIHMTEDP